MYIIQAAENPDVFPIGMGFCKIPCACCDRLYTDHTQFYHLPVNCDRKINEEFRRYLFRNVACEHRKTSDIARHMPDIPGWS